MDISTTTLIGSAAGTLTTVAFVPQVVKAWRTQSLEDLSLGMLLTFATGVALWIIYGVEMNAVPVVVTNGATLFLTVLLLVMKMRPM